VQNTACARDFSITLSVDPVVNGYLTLLRPRKGEDGEEEEWCPHISYTVARNKLTL